MKSLWIGPRSNVFMREIANALTKDVGHCVFFLPERHHMAFLSAFRRHMENSSNFVHVAFLERGMGLLESLKPVFCSDEVGGISFEQLPLCHVRQCSVPILVCSDLMHPAFPDCVALAKILKANAKASRDSGDRLPWQMLILTVPGAPFPAQDVGFTHFHWWGKLRPSDLQFVIEEEFDYFNMTRPVWLWRYSLCLGLCESAFELVSKLAKAHILIQGEVENILRAHPLATKKNALIAKKLLNERNLPKHRRAFPGKEAMEAWREGIIEIGCNDVVEIHPAVVLAAGRKDILNNSLLRSQIQVYFPLVREVCLILRRWLKNHVKVWRKKPELSEAIEIGPFQNFFYENPDIAKTFPDEKEMTYLWWHIRNKLAHGNLIEVKLALKAVLLLERVKETLSEEDMQI